MNAMFGSVTKGFYFRYAVATNQHILCRFKNVPCSSLTLNEPMLIFRYADNQLNIAGCLKLMRANSKIILVGTYLKGKQP